MKKSSNASEICGEVLWNNAWIVSNGETLYNKHFVDKGILTVKNIIDESGRPLSWASFVLDNICVKRFCKAFPFLHLGNAPVL